MLSRRLLGLGRSEYPRLLLAAGIGLLVVASYALQGLAIASVLAVVLGGEDLGSVWWAVALIVVMQVIRVLLVRWRERVAMDAAGRIKATVRDRLYGKLAELGPGHMVGNRTGQMQTTLQDAVEHLEPYFARYVPILVSSVVGATAIALIISSIDLVIGLVVAISAALVPIAPRLFSRLVQPWSTRWSANYRRLFSESVDGLQGMTTLLSFNANRRWAANMDEAAAEFARSSTGLTAVWGGSEFVVGFAGAVGTGLAVGIGALRVADGGLDLDALLVILMLSREAFRPMTELRRAVHAAYPVIGSSGGIFELEDAVATTPEPARPLHPTAADVVFDDVSFRYQPDRSWAVDSVSFRVDPGETVAIVGRSGSGKSTLSHLLMRFYDPQAGAISIGGVDVRDIPLDDLRARIAIVAQDTYLFHGTVADNLRLGVSAGAKTSQLESALRAGSADFVFDLPNGLDSVVGERGVKLSGGERQRLAIARAVLKDAPILILDEPTSSVDSANEAEIQRALAELSRDRTTIVIAHRLSTISDADRIVVMDGGRVSEMGSPSELAAGSGTFSRLIAAQVSR